jgi:hypothetical protein
MSDHRAFSPSAATLSDGQWILTLQSSQVATAVSKRGSGTAVLKKQTEFYFIQ